LFVVFCIRKVIDIGFIDVIFLDHLTWCSQVFERFCLSMAAFGMDTIATRAGYLSLNPNIGLPKSMLIGSVMVEPSRP
jgi:hypothetical protein